VREKEQKGTKEEEKTTRDRNPVECATLVANALGQATAVTDSPAMHAVSFLRSSI